MIANAKTRHDRISALVHAIDLLRYAYFGAFVDVEFEMKAHEIADRGDAVTGQTLSEIYCGLYKPFNGIDAGVTVFDASACAGWINRPAIYYDFYFYKYLTAVSAATYFVDGLEKNDAATRKRYFDLLKAGGSDDPYILLKRAGFEAVIAKHLTDIAVTTMGLRANEAHDLKVSRLLLDWRDRVAETNSRDLE